MKIKSLHSLVPVVLLVILLLGLTVSASAEFVMDKNSTLTGTGTVQNVLVYSLVTRELVGDAYVYTYSYDVTYDAGTSDIHIFGIERPSNSPFFNAANTAGFTTNPDPATAGAYMMEWTGGFLSVGQTGNFSYQSYNAPQEISVYSWAIDGGDYALGTAIGMGAMIPEPGTMAAMAFGLIGLAGTAIRRRK